MLKQYEKIADKISLFEQLSLREMTMEEISQYLRLRRQQEEFWGRVNDDMLVSVVRLNDRISHLRSCLKDVAGVVNTLNPAGRADLLKTMALFTNTATSLESSAETIIETLSRYQFEDTPAPDIIVEPEENPAPSWDEPGDKQTPLFHNEYKSAFDEVACAGTECLADPKYGMDNVGINLPVPLKVINNASNDIEVFKPGDLVGDMLATPVIEKLQNIARVVEKGQKAQSKKAKKQKRRS